MHIVDKILFGMFVYCVCIWGLIAWGGGSRPGWGFMVWVGDWTDAHMNATSRQRHLDSW